MFVYSISITRTTLPLDTAWYDMVLVVIRCFCSWFRPKEEYLSIFHNWSVPLIIHGARPLCGKTGYRFRKQFRWITIEINSSSKVDNPTVMPAAKHPLTTQTTSKSDQSKEMGVWWFSARSIKTKANKIVNEHFSCRQGFCWATPRICCEAFDKTVTSKR